MHTTGGNYEDARKLIFGRATQLNHLISGLVMAGGFLVGFLPLYTGFLERLGGYDKHFGVIDEKVDRVEKDIAQIQADVRSGNQTTQVRLDTLIKSLGETRELILSKGAK
jgi:hypothetical protein